MGPARQGPGAGLRGSEGSAEHPRRREANGPRTGRLEMSVLPPARHQPEDHGRPRTSATRCPAHGADGIRVPPHAMRAPTHVGPHPGPITGRCERSREHRHQLRGLQLQQGHLHPCGAGAPASRRARHPAGRLARSERSPRFKGPLSAPIHSTTPLVRQMTRPVVRTPACNLISRPQRDVRPTPRAAVSSPHRPLMWGLAEDYGPSWKHKTARS